MGRRGRPTRHQADTLGTEKVPVWVNGQLVEHRITFYGRCRCGWEAKFNRSSRQQAVKDWEAHRDEVLGRVKV